MKIPAIVFALMATGFLPLAAQSATLWKPGSILKSEWEQNAWKLEETARRTYTPTGKVATSHITEAETGSEFNYVYTYNDADQLASCTVTFRNGSDWEPYRTTTYVYDPVVKTYCIEKASVAYLNGTPVNAYGAKAEVSRNDLGNVTGILFYKGNGIDADGRPIWKEEMRTAVSYNADNQASEITIEEADTATDGTVTWSDNGKFTELEWAETDGQYLFPPISEIDDEEDSVSDGDGSLFDETGFSVLLKGNNRITKCRMVTAVDADDDDPTDITVTAAYDGDVVTGTLAGDYEELKGLTGSYTLTALENNGNSYTMAISIPYMGMSIAMNIDGATEYDEWGHLISQVMTESSILGNSTIAKKTGTVTMGDDGFPKTYVLQEMDADSGVMENKDKYEYADYSPAGIAETGVDADQPEEYYSLQGIRIPRPAKGLYLIRKGAKTSKAIR